MSSPPLLRTWGGRQQHDFGGTRRMDHSQHASYPVWLPIPAGSTFRYALKFFLVNALGR